MLFDTKGYRLFLRPGHVDFRKASHSLALLVEQEMELSPFDKCMFLFCSSDRSKIKILLWEDNGFWLLQKLCCFQHNFWISQNPVPSQMMHLMEVFALVQKMNRPPCSTSIFICPWMMPTSPSIVSVFSYTLTELQSLSYPIPGGYRYGKGKVST